jgi:ATP-dependent Clp protease protease subunit
MSPPPPLKGTTGSPDNAIPSLDEHHYYMFTREFDNFSTSDAIAFIIQRNLMKPANRPEEIKMIINSPGGDVNSCFALLDTMKGSHVPIATFGLGLVASCGLMTFIGGQKGRRFITNNTSMLSHQYSWGSIGKEHELFATVKEFNYTAERIMNHYKKCTGLTEKRIKEILLPPQDVWLTAKEAVRYGVADKIVDFY